jgi:hydrogenase-4 component E
VVGYLVLENGIFLFGVLFVRETPWLMELGVMLDLLVGVFVMGIAIFHINETFDHIEVDRLTGPEGPEDAHGAAAGGGHA